MYELARLCSSAENTRLCYSTSSPWFSFCESLFKVTKNLDDLVLKEKLKCCRKFYSYIISKEEKGESVKSFG